MAVLSSVGGGLLVGGVGGVAGGVGGGVTVTFEVGGVGGVAGGVGGGVTGNLGVGGVGGVAGGVGGGVTVTFGVGGVGATGGVGGGVGGVAVSVTVDWSKPCPARSPAVLAYLHCKGRRLRPIVTMWLRRRPEAELIFLDVGSRYGVERRGFGFPELP